MAERRFDLDGGKYTVILNSDGYTVTALRHGEPWRDFVGDKFVSLLVQEFFKLVDASEYDYGVGYEDYPDDSYPLTLQEALESVETAQAGGDHGLKIFRAPKGADVGRYKLYVEEVPASDPAPRSVDVLPVGSPELPSRVDGYQSPEANGHRWPCSLYYTAAQDLLNYTCSCGRIPWVHCDRPYLHAPHRRPDRVMQCGGVS